MALTAPGGVKTVLVVDDDPLVLNFVGRLLKQAGFSVLLASSGNRATEVQAAFAGKIDLLLCDVMMPGISGPDLAKKLKESRPEMRIMLMSGYAGGDMLILNHGWDFVQKPFLPKTLLRLVNEVLSSNVPDQGTSQFDTRE